MIEALCSRIWDRQAFHEEKDFLILQGLKFSLNDDTFDDCSGILPRLIQCATHFSLSANINHRKAAYEIGVNALKICSAMKAKDKFSTIRIMEAVAFILGRLGNFPAQDFLKQQMNGNHALEFALPLWFEQEFHRGENTVGVGISRSLVLTDFQRELWQSLETHQIVVVNAPTSAGKSFALQHFLASMFAYGRLRRAVYLVPTRALISQVLSDMTGLIRNDLKLNIQISEVPYPPNAKDAILFVLTQERLQILLDQTNQEIEFVVVDEAHNIADAGRGIILQSVIERIRERSVTANILFGSPFAQNPEVFAYTFGISRDAVRVVNTDESPVSQNLIHVRTNKYKPKSVEVYKIGDGDKEYKIFELDAGTELVREEQTIAQLAHLFGARSLNIVYGSEPVKCETIAGIISDIVAPLATKKGAPDPDLADFGDFLKEHIHKDFLLSEFVKKGVAYHYGNLPAFLRKGLEHLFSQGKISFIVCTSTLLQGINLPAQNMFIMNPSKGVDRETRSPIPLTPTDFWNLAGRAGRLTKDFEGNVYLINIEDWLDNPLGKSRRYRINPSFSEYVCQRTDELLDFISNEEHPSGRAGHEGLENSFMKLFNDLRSGRIESVLKRYEPDLSKEVAAKLVAKIEMVANKITVPREITDRNPNVSVYRQQEMLDHLRQRLKEKGAQYLIPPHPLFKYDRIQNDYLRLFKRMHSHFEKKKSNDKSHTYYANLSLLWMRGRSYAELLRNQIEYKNKHIKRGRANANTEARLLFREIENGLRFKYVKYSRCYIDLLSYCLRDIGDNSYETIPPIYLFLELGASSKTMISLIGLGISRTSASILSEHAPRTDMERDAAIAWLRSTDVVAKGLPRTVVREVEKLL